MAVALMTKTYKHLSKPLQQARPEKCRLDCTCDDNTCPCFDNQTTCESSCKCKRCSRRFPSCRCDGPCNITTCLCWAFSRDCTQSCGCTACLNTYKVSYRSALSVQESSISGQGLFAVSDFEENAMLGEYTGHLVLNSEPCLYTGVGRFAYSRGKVKTMTRGDQCLK